jgi:transposase
MALRVRELTAEEARTLQRLAQARKAPAREVQRAQMVWLAAQGQRVPAIARQLRVCEPTVRLWLKRFNAQGVPGLHDVPRPGCPRQYSPEQVGEVIAAALTPPAQLGQPFGTWTLDRLTTYLNEVRGIPIKRSRVDEVLLAEGLRWRTQETWFGERVDPQFAETRGPSNSSTRRLRRVV